MGLIMGSYLSKPETEKESTDESNNKLNYGASSMQGWRLSHEDALNCILEYDKDSSFFAIYDGHGGQEVAQYSALKLPQFIKDTQEYQEGKIEEALIKGFLGFDAAIATDEVVEVLKGMMGRKSDDSDEEENVDHLYEEAAMPIEKVIEKYAANLTNPAIRALKESGELSKLCALKTKKDDDSTVGTSAGCSSSSGAQGPCGDGVSSSSEAEANEKSNGSVKLEGSSLIPEVKISVPDSSDMQEAASSTPPKTIDVQEAASSTPSKAEPTQNGEASSSPDSEAQAKTDVTSSLPTVENGQMTKKGKGKAVIKPGLPPKKSPMVMREKRNAQELYKELLNFSETSDDDSVEEDKTFEGPVESSDDEDDSVNVAIDVDGSEEESSDEDEDDDELDEDDEESMGFGGNMGPGFESGTTAVVAVLRGNELYVANAGDSRCVVSRNGKAVDMSLDHKPEDQPERDRIVKAGGKVTYDGRVNDGLNLSRALGDHAYKQNKELSDREQMIVALPDVKTITINPSEDEFMVLACDGIWNSMSSQKVVDFVKERLSTEGDKKLSQICEEMFDHCLAPGTLGDGTGCDNMTAIIVQFKPNILKRVGSPQQSQGDAKKAKTEESEPQIDTTV